MSRDGFSEEELVELPAVQLFRELGWQTVDAGTRAGGLFGRETLGDVVLPPRLHAALARLNPGVPPDALAAAAEILTRDRSAMSLEAANREVYGLLKNGVSVPVPDLERGGHRDERLRVVDWQNPAENDFLLLRQFPITGTLYNFRPDLVGFVNGLPLLVVEFKKPGVAARTAFDGNLRHYKSQIPALFVYNAFLIASNGTESRVGSLTADWDRFFEWKRIADEKEPRRVSLEVLLRGTCDPHRFFDMLENFTLFSEHKAGLVKVLGQNHQFLGVNSAIHATLAARSLGDGRGGVFWQTQGSGKSFSMVFYAQKILRRHTGNWTFIIITDRLDLDDQIAKTFKAVGAVSEAEGDTHAQSGAHLRELLRGNHRYVFTLVQKFNSPELLCDRADVIVLTDEAHRSQYDTFATNMRAALPRATFLAFTGTPLIAGEERTRDLFGDYVSIYNFRQSVEDGATVPLFYENRTPELQIVNPDLDEELYRVVEEAGLDPDQEARLERDLSRQYHILTRDDRLEKVAKDIVRHFLGRGFLGKAMVVSLDKATALRMYNKVQKYWAEEKERVLAEIAGFKKLTPTRRAELDERLRVLEETDMALVVSPAQNEIEDMKKLGLDIEKHRQRAKTSKVGLDEKFKDADDPLRIVFVCAMWLTGFDAPSCSTIYLDKPMRNHTLMQTIARANRVFPGKHSGVIVDYANVFVSLEKALAIYGAGKPGENNPVEDKKELAAELRRAIDEVGTFCGKLGIRLEDIEESRPGEMARLSALGFAIDTLISPDARREKFLEHEKWVATLYSAVKPDPAAATFTRRVALFAILAKDLRARLSGDRPSLDAVLAKIEEVLDDAIAGIEVREAGPPPLDLSKIDFEALAKRFAAAKHPRIELEQLKAAIKTKLDKMVRQNRTRGDLAEVFAELIESYNQGSRSVEEMLQQLLLFTQKLTEEEERHLRENLTEEELVLFDLLTRPAPDLDKEERAEVKKVAKDLLARMKELLVLNWRKKAAARANLKLKIEDTLEDGLPRAYSKELYQQKCAVVFEHFWEMYPERNTNVYAEAS